MTKQEQMDMLIDRLEKEENENKELEAKLEKFAEKLKGKLHDFGDGGEKGAYITEKDIDELITEVGGTNNDH